MIGCLIEKYLRRKKINNQQKLFYGAEKSNESSSSTKEKDKFYQKDQLKALVAKVYPRF